MRSIKDRLKEMYICRAIRRSGLFDPEHYLRNNLDVARSCMDPIKHYIRHGWREGRNPSKLFDTKWYIETYTNVSKAGVNPLYHFLKHGAAEGRAPSASVSTDKHLAANPNTAQSATNPAVHCLEHDNRKECNAKSELVVSSLTRLQPVKTTPRAAFMDNVNTTISSDLLEEVHCNIRKELFASQ
jgi:hypothetical protein